MSDDQSKEELIAEVRTLRDRVAALEGADAARRESEARLRLLSRATREAVWDLDLTTGRVWRGEGFQALFGYSPEAIEPAYDWWADRIHPDDRARVLAEVPAPEPGGARQWSFEYRFRRADGSYADVLDQGFFLADAAGRPTRALGSMRDVSDLKAAEAALRESRDRLEVILQGVADGILVLDPAGRVTYANATAARIIGFPSPEALVATPPDELLRRAEFFDEGGRPLPPERLPAFRVLGGEPEAEELIHWRDLATRADRWGYFRALPVRGLDGRPRLVVLIAHDVTERRRLEEQVRQAQKMDAVGRLAGGVAHDFNNLLTAIAGFGTLARDGLGPADPNRPFLDEILKAARRAADLTGQLLAFGRRQLLTLKDLDLNALVRDAELLFGRLVGERVRLVTDLAPDLGPVRADPGRLEQVLLNLVVNARDAMPGGGTLTVTTANVTLDAARKHLDVGPGPYVLLTVADTGVGMDPATAARVFEPFFTTKPVGKGTGLGLATAYGIIKQSGGHIDVETAPSRGSTFRVYLPRPDPAGAAAAARPTPPAPPPAPAATLLVVEDDAMVRSLTRLALEQRGYRVLVAAGGPDALRLAGAHEGPIDLLVTDVVMPGMGGREVAERLAAARPGLRVLFLSGYIDDAALRQQVAGAEVGFLQKPFTPTALAREVRQALDRPPKR
jgi:PAS domain S-box-containing protein